MDKTVHVVKTKNRWALNNIIMQRAKFYIASAGGFMPVRESRQVQTIGQLANNRGGLASDKCLYGTPSSRLLRQI